MVKTSKIGLPSQGTHPLWWLAAIICSIITIIVIIVGIVIFIGYFAIHPRIPFISVINGHLDTFQYSQAGILMTQATIVVRSENDNMKAHARYTRLHLQLLLGGKTIAHLIADAYDVRKNSTLDFVYQVTSNSIPLSPSEMQLVDEFLDRDDIRFDLTGHARTQWKVGPLGSVKFWCQLNCQLHFRYSNRSFIPSRCTSKAT